MAFLAKIRNFIKRYQNRDFRTSLQREKTQKYLFRGNNFSHSRSRWRFFFQNKTNRLSPFSRYIQAKIHNVSDVASRQQIYLGYIGAFLIACTFYIVGYSPYFHISPSKVIMENLTDGIDMTITYRTIEDLYWKSVFLINEEEIANSLKKYQKNIAHIRIDRLYPNGLKILLSSYPIPFDINISTIKDRAWWMSENGILIPKDQIKTPQKYKLTYQSDVITDDIFLDYKELFSESKAHIIAKTLSFFETNWNDLKIKESIFLEKENEFHIVLVNGTHILFTLQNFAEKSSESPAYKHLTNQILTLKTFVEKYRAEIIAGKYTYIDARISGKVFSCQEKGICFANLTLIYGESYK